MSAATLCVFAKPPRPGVAKTRLGPSFGAQGAADLARAFFRDTWALASTLPWAKPVLATTDPEAPEWLDERIDEVWPQGEGDLGDRLERALGRALTSRPVVLAIGADTPGMPRALLEEARCALERSDVVLGPARDGGFYLIGLKHCPPGLLARLPWSSDETFARTLARLTERGLATHVLPGWFDVDTQADVAHLRERLERGELHAPETARILDRLSRGPLCA